MSTSEAIGVGLSLITIVSGFVAWAGAVLWKLAQLVSEFKHVRTDMQAHNVTIKDHDARLDNHEVRLVKLEGS